MAASELPAADAHESLRESTLESTRPLGVRTLDRLGGLGARPEDSRDERLRQGTLIFASVLIAVMSGIWVVTYFAFGYPTSAAIPALYQVLTVVGLRVLSRTRRFDVFRTTQLVAFLVLPGLLQASLGGFVASSGMILWAIFTPLGALVLLGVRRSVGWLVAFCLEVVVLAALDPRLSQSPAALPTALVITFFVLNVIGTSMCSYVMLGYFVEQRERAHHALVAERARSERLLLNVLPQPIAERLKAGATGIAEHYDDVSVCFADLVGFTEHSSVMAADELVALLDQIFSAFDQVAALRIGIATGPAVAGVIGRRKFIYDLWGDTVNTASRMESHGLPGEIQVTERVAAALGSAYAVRLRGVIDVKGKGPMATYLLERAEPPDT